MFLRFIIDPNQVLSGDDLKIRGVVVGVGMILLSFLYCFIKRSKKLQRYVEKSINAFAFTINILLTVIFSLQIRRYLDTNSTDPNAVLGSALFVATFPFIFTLFFTGYLISSIFLLSGLGGMYIIIVRGTYMLYFMDSLRVAMCWLAVCLFLYQKEKRTKEILLKLFETMDNERRWKGIAMHLSEGIVAFDEELRIVYRNYSLVSAFNLQASENNEEKTELEKKMDCIRDLKYIGDRAGLDIWTDALGPQASEVKYSLSKSSLLLILLYSSL
jgi:hypothetical protein